MAYWENVQDEASEPEVTTGDFTDIRLTTNGAGITIFYGDPDADIPKPPNAAQLDGARRGRRQPGARRAGQHHHHDRGRRAARPPTTSGEPSDSTSTTAAAEETTTTAAP